VFFLGGDARVVEQMPAINSSRAILILFISTTHKEEKEEEIMLKARMQGYQQGLANHLRFHSVLL
jgi:hypothetical protein